MSRRQVQLFGFLLQSGTLSTENKRVSFAIHYYLLTFPTSSPSLPDRVTAWVSRSLLVRIGILLLSITKVERANARWALGQFNSFLFFRTH